MISSDVIGICGDIEGVWIAPVTAQVITTLRLLATVQSPCRKEIDALLFDAFSSREPVSTSHENASVCYFASSDANGPSANTTLPPTMVRSDLILPTSLTGTPA